MMWPSNVQIAGKHPAQPSSLYCLDRMMPLMESIDPYFVFRHSDHVLFFRVFYDSFSLSNPPDQIDSPREICEAKGKAPYAGTE